MAESSHRRQAFEDDDGVPAAQPPRAADPFVIASFSEDFDIDAVFKSEAELAREAGESDVPGPNVQPIQPPTQLIQPARPVVQQAAPVVQPAPIQPEPEVHVEVVAAAPPPPAEPAPAKRYGTVSIADVIETQVRLEAHEAVAIVRRLCASLAQHSDSKAQRPLIEPWNVELTGGELTVRPGATGVDPVVKQVGRLLGALLQHSLAPAELRLIASQASFDVPLYPSVEELSVALKRFERAGSVDPIREAFNRALEVKYAPRAQPHRVDPPSPAVPAAGSQNWLPQRLPPTAQVARVKKPAASARIVVAAGGAIVALALMAWLYGIRDSGGDTPQRPAAVTSPAPEAPLAVLPARRAPDANTALTPPVLPLLTAPARNEPAVVKRNEPEPIVRRTPSPAIDPRPPAPPVRTAIAPPRVPTRVEDPLNEAVRRGSALAAAGDIAGAAIVFDSIVMRDPRYRLDAAQATAEVADLLKRSKQTLLPTLAHSHNDAGRAALERGDFSLAVTEAERSLRLLEDPEIGSAGDESRRAAGELLSTASAAARADEQTVYTADSKDVTPPRPLGRQLPAPPRRAAPSDAIGRLEILVGRSGAVERVTLHTPTNAYQERMIVSAAKAWRYRPALRNGRPVRFSLLVSITLPGVD